MGYPRSVQDGKTQQDLVSYSTWKINKKKFVSHSAAAEFRLAFINEILSFSAFG